MICGEIRFSMKKKGVRTGKTTHLMSCHERSPSNLGCSSTTGMLRLSRILGAACMGTAYWYAQLCCVQIDHVLERSSDHPIGHIYSLAQFDINVTLFKTEFHTPPASRTPDCTRMTYSHHCTSSDRLRQRRRFLQARCTRNLIVCSCRAVSLRRLRRPQIQERVERTTTFLAIHKQR